MSLFSWIIFGGLAGWVASIVVGKNDRQGCIGNVIVGVLGAFIGGTIFKYIQRGSEFGFSWESFGWDWESFGVAVIGSILLLLILGRR